jgi:hypothetical protein
MGPLGCVPGASAKRYFEGMLIAGTQAPDKADSALAKRRIG